MSRPRIKVDYAIVLRLRDVEHLGWTRMAEKYQQLTGRYISRDTVKRRYRKGKEQQGNIPNTIEINGQTWVMVKKGQQPNIPTTDPAPPSDTK